VSKGLFFRDETRENLSSHIVCQIPRFTRRRSIAGSLWQNILSRSALCANTLLSFVHASIDYGVCLWEEIFRTFSSILAVGKSTIELGFVSFQRLTALFSAQSPVLNPPTQCLSSYEMRLNSVCWTHASSPNTTEGIK
jgi:hypothetical protein